MMIETFPAKRLLTPVRASEEHFFATDWNMNIYRGCNHGCIYCDSRSVCYRIDRFDVVRAKQNALAMLADELRRKRAPGVVGMGATSDPYNAFEKTELLTRGALELLLRYGFGVCFFTKGNMVTRDRDLLRKIGETMPVCATFSITTASDALSRFLEPGAAVSSARFAAMAKLASSGVFTGTWMNPMLPFLTDTEDEVRQVVRRTKECGGRFVICFFGLTLREGDREYFYAALDKSDEYRHVKQRYVDAFGLDYECASPRAEALYRVMKEECEKAGLCSDFRSLNREMKKRLPTQLKLI